MEICQPQKLPAVVNILILDDDQGDRADILDALGESSVAVIQECADPDELPSLSASGDFHICIVDIRYNERNRIGEVRDLIAAYWPRACIIILSYFERDLTAQDRAGAIPINKARFASNRSLLTSEIIRFVSNGNLIDRAAVDLFVKDLRALPVVQEDEHELLCLKGYVVRFYDTYVEVAVEEERKDDFLERLFGRRLSSMIGRGEEKQLRRLRMNRFKFQETGIGQDMQFVYRIYTKGNRTISEVTSIDDDEGSGADIALNVDALEPLLGVEEAELRKVRDSLKQTGDKT